LATYCYQEQKRQKQQLCVKTRHVIAGVPALSIDLSLSPPGAPLAPSRSNALGPVAKRPRNANTYFLWPLWGFQWVETLAIWMLECTKTVDLDVGFCCGDNSLVGWLYSPCYSSPPPADGAHLSIFSISRFDGTLTHTQRATHTHAFTHQHQRTRWTLRHTG